jgi:thymidylate synthase
MEPNYLPRERQQLNFQYRDHLQRILENGEPTQHPYQPTVRRRVLLTLPPMIFNLAHGIPIITERNMPFAKTLTPIAEMLAFIHGARTAEEMEAWGVKWWRTWTTPEKSGIFGLKPGDMGDGSYGAAFNAPEYIWEDVPGHPDGGRYNPKPFDQFQNMILEIRDEPYLSTHKVTSWLPHHCLQHKGRMRRVVVAPCHGDVQVTILGDKLILRMDQRSGDYPVGVPADILMYAALTIMIAHVTGYKPHMLIHSVHDAHIYENQIPYVEQMIWTDKENEIKRVPMVFPTLHLTEEGRQVSELRDFRVCHFELRDYESHPAIKGIPVTE